MKDQEILKLAARSIAALAVRNTSLENLHAGQLPVSETGDFSDVKVVTPTQTIAWNDVSKVNDDEIKLLMQRVVNKIYTCLLTLSDEERSAELQKMLDLGGKYSAMWDEAKYDEGLSSLLEKE